MTIEWQPSDRHHEYVSKRENTAPGIEIVHVEGGRGSCSETADSWRYNLVIVNGKPSGGAKWSFGAARRKARRIARKLGREEEDD